jgi:hypothetical protein
MVAVLKTAVPQGTVGSNPSPSASLYKAKKLFYVNFHRRALFLEKALS